MKKKPCIVIVGGTWGFPHGMAAARRVTLLGRIFLEAGYHVEIIHITVSEKPGKVINDRSKGTHAGLRFTYATGTTVAANHFFQRRLVEWKGLLNTIVQIVRLTRQFDLKATVIYSRQIMTVALLRLVTMCTGKPAILELNEWPVARKNISAPRRFLAGVFCRFSPFLADGFIVISNYIEDRIRSIKAGVNRRVCRVPILVDANIVQPEEMLTKQSCEKVVGDYILFSGSLNYIHALRFILTAFTLVLKVHPACRLVITGKTANRSNQDKLQQAIYENKLGDSVDFVGYVTDAELAQLQRKALCLLAPLENDEQSIARMPTKIAEYLLTGRPVVTTDFGEVSAHFTSGKNAFLCPPEDAQAFAEAIRQSIDDPEMANAIGANGRMLAEQAFDFRVYVQPIRRLVSFLGR